MKKIIIPFVAALIITSVSSISGANAADRIYQTTSLTGGGLSSVISENAKVLENLRLAKAKYDADPIDAENIIWYGRRMAYTGNFRKAVTIFSEGIEKHPFDARFYRHRGHRNISLREFDHAIADFEKATRLIKGQKNKLEQDGAPNSHNIPISSEQGNIWYHLGLAYYLKHDWKNALRAYSTAYETSLNDDERVSTTHWKYMILRRMGRDKDARAALASIHKDMNVLENYYYHRLCLFYKGEISEKEMFKDQKDTIGNSGVFYGQANWYFYNGNQKKGLSLMKKMVDTSKIWAAFGYIAAESDIAHSQKR